MADEQAWTVGRLLTWTADYFSGQGSDSPRLDAEVLLAHALGCPRIALYTRFDETPDEQPRTLFRDLVRQRAAGKPVAYLVGNREFYSLSFAVTPDVLIPRPETEQLVVEGLDRLKEIALEQPTIADIGTGSGAIAVAMAKHAPQADVTAVDLSPQALAIAQQNAEQHGVSERISFVESDLFASVDPAKRFDLILSNPPYVTTNELMGLDPTVRDHEPHLALDGGPDGVQVIERLAPQVAERLNEAGAFYCEIGPSTAEPAAAILERTAGLTLQPTLKDLAGHARIVWATKG